MAYVIDNYDGTKTSIHQSIANQVDCDIIHNGQSRPDCVLEGCVVTAQGFPNARYVAVSSGSVLTNGVVKAVAAVTGTGGGAGTATDFGGAPDTTYYRIDLLVVDSSGALARRAGTAAVIPLMPALTANDVVLAAIFVLQQEDGIPVDITSADISDKRILIQNGPVTLYKTIAAETTNTTAAAIHILNKASSGVVIPKGLMLAGRILRCTIGGTIECSVTTATLKLDILYGGTSVYTATSGSLAALTPLAPFFLTFDILAQGNSDLTLNGRWISSNLESSAGTSRNTTSTTGYGTPWLTANVAFSFSGSSTSSNAVDRTLAVTLTFGTSDADNEIITELATLELI